VVDGLAARSQQSMSAADAEARVLLHDAFKLFPQRSVVTRLRLVAGARAGHFCEAASVGDGLLTLLGLLQDGDDLLIGEVALLRLSILPFG